MAVTRRDVPGSGALSCLSGEVPAWEAGLCPPWAHTGAARLLMVTHGQSPGGGLHRCFRVEHWQALVQVCSPEIPQAPECFLNRVR